MEQAMLETMLKMLTSSSDTDALMGLRGLQGLFESEGTSLAQALVFAVANISAFKSTQKPTIDQAAVPAKTSSFMVNTSGMPDCRMPKPGHIEIILAGKSVGEPVALPGAAAEETETIALSVKDALIAAVINKTRFKLKLVDIKNKRGEIAETVLQAEYEREGMTPVRIWGNVKGEVAALAVVLRKAVANTVPELVAA